MLNKYKYPIIIGLLILIILLVILNPLALFRLHMRLEDNLGIAVTNELLLTAEVEKGLRIQMLDKLNTDITVKDSLSIPLNETFTVPLNTTIFMTDTMNLVFDLPVDVWLDDTELELNDLTIPFNEALYIEDELNLNIHIPMDTTITMNMRGLPKIKVPVQGVIPVDIQVPISQTLQVKDTLVLNPRGYRVRLKTTLPVVASVPINQGIKVNGTLDVPLSKTINAPVLNVFNADVDVTNEVPVQFNNSLKAKAQISDTLRVNMEELKIDPTKVKVRMRK